ncbi:MAG: hypothetical protein Q9203_004056, partial [Teloschistes exilis]
MTSTPSLHPKRYASVALLRHIKNPILLAKEILLRGAHDLSGNPSSSPTDPDPSGPSGGAQGHCFLSGPTAEALGQKYGLETVPEKYFWTRRRWEEHRRGLHGLSPHQTNLQNPKPYDNEGGEEAGKDERDTPSFWPTDSESWDGKEYLPQGTVGCVVLDAYGTLCVATSTGGLTNKLPGRIGDTPSVGAGFWAEEWVECILPPAAVPSMPQSILRKVLLPRGVWDVVGDCLPPSLSLYLPAVFRGYSALTSSSSSPTTAAGPDKEEKEKVVDGRARAKYRTRALALSGTGNGDSFL